MIPSSRTLLCFVQSDDASFLFTSHHQTCQTEAQPDVLDVSVGVDKVNLVYVLLFALRCGHMCPPSNSPAPKLQNHQNKGVHISNQSVFLLAELSPGDGGVM